MVLNRAEVIGRLGADVTVNHLTTGGRVANMSIATDESYVDRDGQKVDKTEWHRVVTFQPGLVDMLEKHARKGRLVYVSGKLQTRRYRKEGEESDRFSTEVLLAPGRPDPVPGAAQRRQRRWRAGRRGHSRVRGGARRPGGLFRYPILTADRPAPLAGSRPNSGRGSAICHAARPSLTLPHPRSKR